MADPSCSVLLESEDGPRDALRGISGRNPQRDRQNGGPSPTPTLISSTKVRGPLSGTRRFHAVRAVMPSSAYRSRYCHVVWRNIASMTLMSHHHSGSIGLISAVASVFYEDGLVSWGACDGLGGVACSHRHRRVRWPPPSKHPRC